MKSFVLLLVVALVCFFASAGAADEFGSTADPSLGDDRRRHFHFRRSNTPLPLSKIKAHICGLHVASGNRTHQMLAHHFCSEMSDGLTQCILYDKNEPNAKLIGVEYIISGAKFAALPKDEQRLWHSHVYEVKNGLANILPLRPRKLHREKKEKECKGFGCFIRNMKRSHSHHSDTDREEKTRVATSQFPEYQKFVGTYGKTFHTWHSDALNGEIPIGSYHTSHQLHQLRGYAATVLGVPELMVSIVADGVAEPKLVEKIDQLTGFTSTERVSQRKDIVVSKAATDLMADPEHNGDPIPTIAVKFVPNKSAKETKLMPRRESPVVVAEVLHG